MPQDFSNMLSACLDHSRNTLSRAARICAWRFFRCCGRAHLDERLHQFPLSGLAARRLAASTNLASSFSMCGVWRQDPVENSMAQHSIGSGN